MAQRHSDVHINAIAAALAKGGAARSPLVASWSRSAHLHGLDPTRKTKAGRMSAAELATARQAMGQMLHVATPSLDRLFQAVGGVGCCVMLADRDGVPLERRGAGGDDSTFQDWGLWLGTQWSEAAMGTNGIGTALVEERVVTIDRGQHFLAQNTILACMSAPLFDEFGQLAGVLDVSSARSDLTAGISGLIVQALTEAAQRIEEGNFRAAFPQARMVLVPNNTRPTAALLAVDGDDLVIGATRAARLALNLPRDIARNPVPAVDALAGALNAGALNAGASERLEDGERAVLMRALARAQGNASAAARNLGISRATFHRKIGARAEGGTFPAEPVSNLRQVGAGAVHPPADMPRAQAQSDPMPLGGGSKLGEDIMNTMAQNTGNLASPFKTKYDNYIGGKFVAPVNGKYFDNVTPITGAVVCQIARSDAADIGLALDAAHAAKDAWGKTSAAHRSNILLKIADRIEENLELIATAETWDNGKPIRETVNADIPLSVDHFRYFAGVLRAQEGTMSEIDNDTVAYHFHEPLGVVGQIIPWNFSILMAAWKLAPALAAGNCIVLKPAEQTPAAIMVLMEIIGDLLPAGVLNIVNGYGAEAGDALVRSGRIAKIAFTGSTVTGRKVAEGAVAALIPFTLELGGKSPNIFFSDVMAADDAFLDKAVEGFVLFAFNQGEVCTCPSRALIQEDIYEKFMDRCIARVRAIKQGDPRDMNTMVGAQASKQQHDKIMSYFQIGRDEGAEVLIGGDSARFNGDIAGGFYIQPTIFKGNNKMRVFQEEIFGPVVSVTTFKDEAEALEIANDTMYGLGAGVWTRDGTRAYRFGRGVQAGRVWVNNYHAYPAHAAFGGYKQSGIGRETHKMMLDHYQQTKNMLVSYNPNKLGFF